MQNNEVEEIIAAPDQVISTDVVASSRKNVNKYFALLLLLIFLVVAVYILLPNSEIESIKNVLSKDNHHFYWM